MTPNMRSSLNSRHDGTARDRRRMPLTGQNRIMVCKLAARFHSPTKRNSFAPEEVRSIFMRTECRAIGKILNAIAGFLPHRPPAAEPAQERLEKSQTQP